MVSFEKFVPGDGPIYQQIVLYIKREISAKNINNGDEMPSRRVLSSLLGINPNTIQKAYKILEDEGIVESHSGAKSVIVLAENKSEEIKTSLMEAQAEEAVRTLKQMGITKEEAVALISKYWKEGE